VRSIPRIESRYPLSPARGYNPPPSTLADLKHLHATLGIDRVVFTQPSVHAALRDYVLVQADVTANDAQDQALMQRFGIIGPPMSLFFKDGQERRGLRLTGFEDAQAFVQRAHRGAE